MPQLKTYRIFISHSWKYSNEYYSLITNLQNALNLEIRNYSVPQDDPLDTSTNRQLLAKLEDQIRPVNVVLVFAGMYSNYSKWIDKEIEIAKRMGKPIIAVKPHGQLLVPQKVINAANEVVGFYTPSIVDAIRRRAI